MNIRSQPLGISGYELSKLIPEEFRGSMPTIEEIEAELNEQLLVLCQALDEEAFKQFMGE